MAAATDAVSASPVFAVRRAWRRSARTKSLEEALVAMVGLIRPFGGWNVLRPAPDLSRVLASGMAVHAFAQLMGRSVPMDPRPQSGRQLLRSRCRLHETPRRGLPWIPRAGGTQRTRGCRQGLRSRHSGSSPGIALVRGSGSATRMGALRRRRFPALEIPLRRELDRGRPAGSAVSAVSVCELA